MKLETFITLSTVLGLSVAGPSVRVSTKWRWHLVFILQFSNGVSPALQNVDVSQARIYQSKPAAYGQFPFHVWISSERPDASLFCGGTLIHGRWVLTAAHCVMGYTTHRIGIGSNNRSSPLIGLTAMRVFVHPNYDPLNDTNNVALLQLAVILWESSDIAPINLPSTRQINKTFESHQVLISGFGVVNNGERESGSEWECG